VPGTLDGFHLSLRSLAYILVLVVKHAVQRPNTARYATARLVCLLITLRIEPNLCDCHIG